MRRLRSFFPSWLFFNEIGTKASLYVRIKNEAEDFSQWNWLDCTLKRSPKNLFLNPRGNYSLLCYSLLEQIQEEINEDNFQKESSLEDSVTYQLILNEVRSMLRSKTNHARAFQFKVTIRSKDKIEEELLVSPVYAWG